MQVFSLLEVLPSRRGEQLGDQLWLVSFGHWCWAADGISWLCGHAGLDSLPSACSLVFTEDAEMQPSNQPPNTDPSGPT